MTSRACTGGRLFERILRHDVQKRCEEHQSVLHAAVTQQSGQEKVKKSMGLLILIFKYVFFEGSCGCWSLIEKVEESDVARLKSQIEAYSVKRAEPFASFLREISQRLSRRKWK